MKKILFLVALTAQPAFSQSTTNVRGHVRSDGVYVPPHVRTNPNETKLDNWSTRGNVNPYTGQTGTVDPYRPSGSNPYGTSRNEKPKSPYGW